MSIERKRLRRAALLGSAATMIAGTVIGQPANAQDLVQDDEATIEQMVVTGSRIKRTGLTAPTPVTVLGAEQLSLSGETNLGNLLNQLPALGSTFSSASSTGFIGTTGLNLLDLRRLGTERTLVLVDGRRHVGGTDATASVDINTISTDLIERVEVITGGASAIYGADAVSGVVNFVLRDDFEGVKFSAQIGDADEGSTLSYFIRGTAGGNFADGRGNAVISAEFSESSGFLSNERAFDRRNESFVANPDDPAEDDPNIPDTILIQDARLPLFNFGGLTTSFFGDGTAAALSPPFGILQLAPNGDLIAYDAGEVFDNFRRSVGGDGVLLSDIGGSTQPDQQRINVSAKVNYELHDYVTLFMEAKYVNNQAQSFGTASFDTALTIQDDNAFLSDQARTLLSDIGATSFNLRRIHNDLGFRSDDIERQTFRGVVGFEGEFDNGLDYELSYVYGRSTNTIVAFNNRINDRFLAATDAVEVSAADVATLESRDLDTTAGPDGISPFAAGDIVCRSTLQNELNLDPGTSVGDPRLPDGRPAPDFAFNGCVPASVFGEGAISAEAAAFINDDSVRSETLEQSVVTGVVTGDSSPWFELPAGPIGFAIGGEYRFETATTRPPGVDILGLTFGNVINVTGGQFDVYEGFAEVSVPVLKDLPFARELAVEAAVRVSDYSTIGFTNTWKVGGTWSPVSDLRFRAVFSRAVRAPNIGELFGAQDQTFLFPEDPCDQENLDAGSDFRVANCNALGAPAGFQQDETAGNIPGTSGGNPDLDEESADTITVGMILQPRWVPGLSITVDYWDIEIEDAIDSPALNDVLRLCVDGPSIDNSFCPLIERDAGTFQITGFTLTQQNIAALEASGVDFEVNYLLDLADVGLDYGSLDFRVIGTWLDARTDFPFQEFPDEPEDETGELGDPEWVVNTNITWNWQGWTLNYELRFISSQLLVENEELAADPDIQSPLFTGRDFFHDIQVRYQLHEQLELYAGINNIGDNNPPFGLSGAGTDSAIFDTIGRFYYGGLVARF